MIGPSAYALKESTQLEKFCYPESESKNRCFFDLRATAAISSRSFVATVLDCILGAILELRTREAHRLRRSLDLTGPPTTGAVHCLSPLLTLPCRMKRLTHFEFPKLLHFVELHNSYSCLRNLDQEYPTCSQDVRGSGFLHQCTKLEPVVTTMVPESLPGQFQIT